MWSSVLLCSYIMSTDSSNEFVDVELCNLRHTLNTLDARVVLYVHWLVYCAKFSPLGPLDSAGVTRSDQDNILEHTW